VYSSAASCQTNAIARYATAIVVAMYGQFILPLLAACCLRGALACRVPGAAVLMQCAIAMGLVAPVLGNAQPPATTAQIRALPREKFDAARFPPAAMCGICLSEYAQGEDVRVLPCDAERRHHFHLTCIDTWLVQHATCPICRASMLDGDELAVQGGVGAEVGAGVGSGTRSLAATSTVITVAPAPAAADGGEAALQAGAATGHTMSAGGIADVVVVPLAVPPSPAMAEVRLIDAGEQTAAAIVRAAAAPSGDAALQRVVVDVSLAASAAVAAAPPVATACAGMVAAGGEAGAGTVVERAGVVHTWTLGMEAVSSGAASNTAATSDGGVGGGGGDSAAV